MIFFAYICQIWALHINFPEKPKIDTLQCSYLRDIQFLRFQGINALRRSRNKGRLAQVIPIIGYKPIHRGCFPENKKSFPGDRMSRFPENKVSLLPVQSIECLVSHFFIVTQILVGSFFLGSKVYSLLFLRRPPSLNVLTSAFYSPSQTYQRHNTS